MPGLRALPDAVTLHYEEVVNADGQIEFCATNHAGFLDLSRLQYPCDGAGRRGALVLGPSGGMTWKPMAACRLPARAGNHPYEKMHVMLVDPSLEDYHHVHPEAEGMNGQYRFRFTPQRGGAYRVFTEVVPLRTRRQVIATGELSAPGPVAAPVFTANKRSLVGGVQFEVSGLPERLTTGRDYRFELGVSDAAGGPVVLETIMGAKGHMVAFDAAQRGFAHMHPVDSIAGAEGGDDLAFLFNVPNAGWYRVFAQVQVALSRRFSGALI